MNKKTLEHIINTGETTTVEFKTNFNNEVVETLVAFANAQGGKVLIGISNDKNVVGVSLQEESVQNWINEIKQKTAPSLIPDADVLEIAFKKVLVFTIKEYPIKPVSFRGRYYKRMANANHLLSVEEVVNMHLQTINSSWDYHTNNYSKIDDISFEKVQSAIEVINKNGTIINEDPINFLFKKDLIKNEKLTNAAFLLFTKKDTVITTVELGRFQTSIIIKDNDRSQTDLIAQVNQIIGFVEKHINKAIIITGKAQHTQEWQYPMEAIREIVLNMVVHRDYRDTADSIVKIFDDYIEFFNPGRLPENISEKDLIENTYTSTPRNKLIADIFRSMGLIEKYGSGIRRIINYCTEAGLPKPTFQNQGNGFLVRVYGKKAENVVENVVENVAENVAENEKKILRLIDNNSKYSAKQMSKLLGLTQRTVQRYLKELQTKNIIERIGPAKGGYWHINKNND
ncbi:MAG: ATP-binding protein [Bacteroidota bacterium]